MTREAPEIDLKDIAAGFQMPPEEALRLMRAGSITCRLHEGRDEDEGRFACLFFHGNKRLTLIADAAGTILRRSLVDFGQHPLPPAMRQGPQLR